LVGTALALGLLLAGSGAATGENFRGTNGPDRLQGTPTGDSLDGRGGPDRIDGRGGPDLLIGGPGRDVLVGGPGDDRFVAQEDGAVDSISCGSGHDIVDSELGDRVGRRCEVVARQLSRDTTVGAGLHRTEVEPTTLAVGSTVLAAFQLGRYAGEGGADALGFSTSRNGGRTWRSGVLPAHGERMTDPAIAYDRMHGVWLVAGISIADDQTDVYLVRSRDGVTWSAPVVAAVDPAQDYDKEWIVCDNGRSSPFRGRCYISYLDAESDRIMTLRSSDGGLTWSRPSAAPSLLVPRPIVNGAQPMVLSDGTLLVVYTVFGRLDLDGTELDVIRSTDGGATFSGPLPVASVRNQDVSGMRAAPLPSAAVDGAGRIYVAWSDCRFEPECGADDVVVASSRDGVSWSQPARVPTAPVEGDLNEFLPALAATGSGRLAITYYSLKDPEGCDIIVTCPGLDVSVIESTNGGSRWRPPLRLNAESMPLWWLVDSGTGRMVGDYVGTTFPGTRPLPVFTIASRPATGLLHESIYAATKLAR
jgi:hypothetical protein